ncbi:MAG TPA: hypothetical protein VE861_00665, partial [Gemmatimonadaceae bacterium]|nr:hypothetical protein [Gemmatimonadaceae bacterium]
MPQPPLLPPDADDDLPPAGTGSGNERLQRWVDLLAALLIRNAPASFTDLAADVPGYRTKLDESLAATGKAKVTALETLKRAFERDKDELRRFGVPIESEKDEDGNVAGRYRLKRNDFYLPYLCMAMPDGGQLVPPHVDVYGYKTLSSESIEPDELAVIVDAAATVRALGDPLLRTEVDTAMRKLAVDLPVDESESPDVPRLVAARVQPDGKLFAELSEALRHRKVVTFTYHAMSSDVREERSV